MDFSSLFENLKQLDLPTLLVAVGLARVIEAAAIRIIKPLPGLVVRRIKNRINALAAAGKIDAPTMRLLKAYAKATFVWADEELPDNPGPEKMAAVIDRLSGVPYVGMIVRADRAGAQAVLQAAYDAINDEAKAQTEKLKAEKDAKETPPKDKSTPATEKTSAPS